MYDLQLLGVHEDGEHVVFLGTDGQRYRVPIDDALRAAVRRDRARLSQLQISGQTLRPRDIQARIRAGRRAEDIAAESGLSLDYVERFTGPVLAERENVVMRARQTRIRRRDEVGPLLGQLADERLEARGVDLQFGTGWDAWREDDGTWTVQVSFSAGGKERTARWRFDLPAAHLTASDDESRWLISEHSEQPTGRRSREIASTEHDLALDRVLRRRMETVEIRSAWPEQHDQPAMPAEPEPVAQASYEPEPELAEPAEQEPTAAEDSPVLHPTLELDRAALREHRAEPSSVSDSPANSDPEQEAPDEVIDVEAVARSAPGQEVETELPPAAHPAASHPEDIEDSTVLEPAAEAYIEVAIDATDPAPPKDDADQSNPETQVEEDAKQEVAVTQQNRASKDNRPKPGPRPRKQQNRRGNRASVPSWDDILFGAKKD